MNYILDGKQCIIGNSIFHIYLHSDQVIIHKNPSQIDTKRYYQIQILQNAPDWDNGFASSNSGLVACILPNEIKTIVEKYLQYNILW